MLQFTIEFVTVTRYFQGFREQQRVHQWRERHPGRRPTNKVRQLSVRRTLLKLKPPAIWKFWGNSNYFLITCRIFNFDNIRFQVTVLAKNKMLNESPDNGLIRLLVLTDTIL